MNLEEIYKKHADTNITHQGNYLEAPEKLMSFEAFQKAINDYKMTDWIEIKTLDDLPKEERFDLVVIDKDNEKEYNYHYLTSMDDYWMKHFTHWKIK